ncbi:hypothetical protein MMC22_004165 [Lobaria immixta]|nr:hypothetical protein [Lobaria immixta]
MHRLRYAASPAGASRWQPPHTPALNRGTILKADARPPQCPQPNLAAYPEGVYYVGDEDCLFLSVYAPQNASQLPVLVYIHGGAYGLGRADTDPSDLINTNHNGFIAVVIQYRLGAFGFLSSDEVHRYGTPNAGILDQYFSLQWVQTYIHLFGGDRLRVTIAGESSGGGSVMLQTMAFGGYQGDSLFSNAIVASPYLPMQYGYADFQPSQAYYAFAQAAGCFNGHAYGSSSGTIFECLVGKDTKILQSANARISLSGTYGTWAFLPVTDGAFIQQRPSEQLLKKQVNGVRILSGNNADEGPLSLQQNIRSEEDFLGFLRRTFPLFTNDDISKVLRYYPSTNDSVDLKDLRFATLGDGGPTALNESSYATGQLQRANNLHAEITFVCPSYWLAEAFTDKSRAAYRYQLSVPVSYHSADLSGYFGPPLSTFGPDFERAFMTLWGNFIIHNDPSVPAAIANGASSPDPSAPNPASTWPRYTTAQPYLINLNETGGELVTETSPVLPTIPVNVHRGPGLRNDFTLKDAYTWEGGRGVRCDFWKSVGEIMPA